LAPDDAVSQSLWVQAQLSPSFSMNLFCNSRTVALVQVLITQHPLVSHKLTTLRAQHTDSATFRALTDELVTLLAYEATRNIEVDVVQVQTPVAIADGVKLSGRAPMVVPILRAGLGMLNGMMHLLPTAEVGFLGMMRDEETLASSIYADRIPSDLTDRHVFLLDPMLATGGTLISAIDIMLQRGAAKVTAICLLASPEGISALEVALAERQDDIVLVTAAVDERLNEKGYIVPGLGDAGDRLFGVV
jgi:uracil phosphoribosyltransferase